MENTNIIMEKRLQDKIAIIAGAGCVGPGWGNGRAEAVIFAKHGAKIFAVDKSLDAMRETKALIDDFGGTVKLYQCNMMNSAEVKSMVEACISTYHRVDVLVNNVGGSVAGGPVELSEEAWSAQVDYNLKTAFLSCKHVIPVMENLGGGAIVNTASTAGIRWTGAAHVAYAAAKAGIIQFSRVAAVQYAPKGIRVNTVIPGQMHTPMVEARLANQRTKGNIKMLLEQRLARIPLGFMGDGRDIAHAALFLASDEARFITGTEIIVDGGMTVCCD